MPITDKREDLANVFLGTSPAEWEDIKTRKMAGPLMELSSLVTETQDELEDAQRFWNTVKEDSLLPKVDKQLNLLDRIRAATVDALTDENVDDTELLTSLDYVNSRVKKAYSLYARVEEETLSIAKSSSIAGPKTAKLMEGMRNYWNFIDSFWKDVREDLLESWNSYFSKSSRLLTQSLTRLQPKKRSAHSVLANVSRLLTHRSMHFAAQRVADTNESIKNYYVKEEGLIPSYMGAHGVWKVAKDDCPDTELPIHHTKLTDHFAFCRMKNKVCPSYDRSRGSYVKCKSFITLKTADLIGKVKKISSKKFLDLLDEIAETDPHIRKLFIEADRRSGSLYYGKTTDTRLKELLSGYSRSERKGTYDYCVYTVADEPLLVIGKTVVSADPVLLEMISRGEQMPREASTKRVAGPVIRVTFTANAIRDPDFRDFLRKKKGVKSKHFAYDIPFSTEEDIKFFLEEVHEEFGYKIEVFELIEDTESPVEKDFGVYNWHSLPIFRSAKSRLDLTYIPASKVRSQVRPAYNTEASAKLSAVAHRIKDESLRTKVADLSTELRAGSRILIALKRDVIRYASGAIGLLPDVGMRWEMRDPDTGETAPVELVRISGRKKSRTAKYIEYKVRRIDTGKEITVSSPWIRSAGGGHSPLPGGLKEMITPKEEGGNGLPSWAQQPQEEPAEKMPEVELPPEMGMPPSENAFGYSRGDDNTVYLVRTTPPEDSFMEPPEEPSPCQEGMSPPQFGRFPGDVDVSYPEPVVVEGPEVSGPPMMDGPMMDGPMMDGPMMDGPMMDGPMMDGPMMDGPMMESHGPAVGGKDTYIAVDEPVESSEDPAEQEVLDDVKKNTVPGLKFKSAPRRPSAPSGDVENDVENALDKLRKKLKGDPRVKNIRHSLSSKGKPVLYVHSTMPKTLKKELESSVNGFEVVTAPVHEDPEAKDREADSLTNPMKNQPSNGHPTSGYQEEPPTDQVSGPQARSEMTSVWDDQVVGT